MATKIHRKHTKLAKPAQGRFGRNEWAVVGTSCANIQHLARQVIPRLSQRYNCAYVDADHAAANTELPLPGMLAAGAVLEYTDVVKSHELRVPANRAEQVSHFFDAADAVLVNGNHHEAAAQIVVIDDKKEHSLRKRVAQLTNIRLILLAENQENVFDFIEEILPQTDAPPRLQLADVEGVVRFFEREMSLKTPPINGLVLAGGRSLRMGRDKSAISWHGKPQREHLAGMLQPLCEQVFISCRAEQVPEMGSAYPTLPDTFLDLGPFGAILSAFRFDPNAAWLVVACDLPLLDSETLQFLMENRQAQRLATTFQSPFDQKPEPLIAIWEPKSYARLLAFLSQGNSCPRKVLQQSDIWMLPAPNPKALTNVNTPEDAADLGY